MSRLSVGVSKSLHLARRVPHLALDPLRPGALVVVQKLVVPRVADNVSRTEEPQLGVGHAAQEIVADETCTRVLVWRIGYPTPRGWSARVAIGRFGKLLAIGFGWRTAVRGRRKVILTLSDKKTQKQEVQRPNNSP